jgi:hypothetical protein
MGWRMRNDIKLMGAWTKVIVAFCRKKIQLSSL